MISHLGNHKFCPLKPHFGVRYGRKSGSPKCKVNFSALLTKDACPIINHYLLTKSELNKLLLQLVSK